MKVYNILFMFILLSVFYTIQVNATLFNNNLDNGLINYYSFENNYADDQGGNNLTSNSSINFIGVGVQGTNAINITNSSTHSLNNISISGNQNRTLNFWLKLQNLSNNPIMLWLGNGSTANAAFGFRVDYFTGTQWMLQGYGGGSDYNYSSINTNFNMHTLVYGTNFTWLYINGVNVANFSHLYDTGKNLFYIGGNPVSSGITYGYLDEIGIWNRTINNSEISFLYNSGAGQIPGVPGNFLINNVFYNTSTTETAQETFILNATYNNSHYTILNSYFYYNGTQYSLLNQRTGTNLYVSKDITINNTFNDITNTFYWSFEVQNITGTFYINSSTYSQSVISSKFGSCNSTLNIPYLNFTIYDENSSLPITGLFSGLFNYWTGNGLTYSNFSFGNSTITMNYSFCASPQRNFYINLQSLVTSAGYYDREFYMQNSTLTNITTVNKLYLMPINTGIKFYFNVKQGTIILSDTLIYIQKQNIKNDSYETISIRKTDDAGEFNDYLIEDKKYRFLIVKNNQLLGTIYKSAICQASPCSITLQALDTTGDVWEQYYNTYAQNILSSMNFNNNTKVLTYDFIDTTGTAHYFRLVVLKGKLNESGNNIICNTTLSTIAGSISCNISNYEGQFIATGYISRSPEKQDISLSFIISSLKEAFGKMGLLLSLALVVTLSLAGAAVSGGNPVVMIIFTLFGLIAGVMIGVTALSWAFIASIILIGIILIDRIGT